MQAEKPFRHLRSERERNTQETGKIGGEGTKVTGVNEGRLSGDEMEFFTVTKSSSSLPLLLSLITHNIVHQSYEYKEVPLSINEKGTSF